MLRRLAALALGVSLVACAAAGPYVTKGPVIAGVTQDEAWIAWETAELRDPSKGCVDGAPTVLLSAGNEPGAPFADKACLRIHHVHLTALRPATSYAFALDHGKAHPATVKGRFSTAPTAADAAFSFVIYGDNRDSGPFQASTRPNHEAVAAAILKREGEAAFLVHTGDLALNLPLFSGPDRGYGEFFDVERALLASRPLFPTVGNHEKLELSEFDALVNARSFSRDPHPYYGAMEWGGVHFVFLDSFEEVGIGLEQQRWLESDLAQARREDKLVLAVAHQGPYSHCSRAGLCHGGLTASHGRDALVKLLVDHQVAAIFAGHDHYYQRGREGPGCLHYFVVGGGGAPMYDPSPPGPDAPGVLAAKKLTSYVVVTVKGRAATFEAKGTDGAVFDSGVLAPMEASPQCPRGPGG